MVKIAFDRGPQGLWPLLDRDTVLAVVDAAREANLPVRCHVEDLEGLGMAVETGVDVVEHVPSRGRNVFTGETGAKEPCVRYRELLEAMAGAKILWCPTLDVSTRSTWDGSGMFAAVRTFVEAGGAVALGTDYPFRGVEGGLPSREMDLLLRCGLTGMDVLCSATSRAASALGREDLGRLESGAVADILVVRGDPTNDPGCLRSVLAVFKDGAGI